MIWIANAARGNETAVDRWYSLLMKLLNQVNEMCSNETYACKHLSGVFPTQNVWNREMLIVTRDGTYIKKNEGKLSKKFSGEISHKTSSICVKWLGRWNMLTDGQTSQFTVFYECKKRLRRNLIFFCQW
jgi:hypothetical protein